MRPLQKSGIALVVIASAAACSASPPAHCLPVLLPVFAMLDPSPGATGVPDNLSSLEIEGFGPTSSITVSGGGQAIAIATVQPAPTPTPDDGVPQWFAVLASPLAAHTTYTVTYPYSYGGGNACSASGTATLGSFTTQ